MLRRQIHRVLRKRHLAFYLFTLGALLFLVLAPTPLLAQGHTLSPASLIQPDGTLKLTGGSNGALDLEDYNVSLDPQRGPVLSKPNTATTALGAWSALPNSGLNGTVRALAIYNGALYVGGDFTGTTTGGITVNRIAKFNGTSWSALPNDGLNSSVYALAVYGGNLIVGGSFTDTVTGGVVLKQIAKYNGTSWSAVGVGVSSAVLALAEWSGTLYIGGAFLKTGDSVTTLDRIAAYNGTTISALPSGGLNSTVNALMPLGFDLVVGGDFTAPTSGSPTLGRIAKFDGASWSSYLNNGLNGSVRALSNFDGDLYVGGDFTGTGTGGITLNRIARYDSSWHAVAAGNGLNGSVYALTIYGDELIVGGAFDKTADTTSTLNHIGRYSGTAWSVLPNNGLDNIVRALTVFNGAVFAGGDFIQTKDTGITLNRIGKFAAPTQLGPTYYVNTDDDTDDGSCDIIGQGVGNQDCTLREAINAANAQAGGNTIEFATDYTISLNSPLPTITQDLDLDGVAGKVVIYGGTAYRILRIESSLTLNVNHLYFLGGAGSPALAYGGAGGAIYNVGGTLRVKNSSFANNTASSYGGAIFSVGTTNIVNSTFSVNSADGIGGAVVASDLVVINSTFSDNAAPQGAALEADASLSLVNSILANSTGPDCTNFGTLVSERNNLIESTGAAACGFVNGVNGDIIGVDPKLGPLAYWGGVTTTLALTTASRAIDTGDDSVCASTSALMLDQRGISRPQGYHCDMGAFEFDPSDCGSSAPVAFQLLKPAKNGTMNKTSVKFDWDSAMCATTYVITVKNTTTGAKVSGGPFAKSKATLTLTHGKQKWSVKACNGNVCTKSKTFKFTN